MDVYHLQGLQMVTSIPSARDPETIPYTVCEEVINVVEGEIHTYRPGPVINVIEKDKLFKIPQMRNVNQ